jgi:hypothetical protein
MGGYGTQELDLTRSNFNLQSNNHGIRISAGGVSKKIEIIFF